jgi:UDP-N-acetylmuramoyl-L-alanyl-D-glutamate--2,6-diaminopimelate ligase
VWFRWPGHQEHAPRTTPESVDLYRFLRSMVEADCGHAVLEASSHALALHRVEGVRFQVGVFTNLTQDHLDFHRDMESYFAAKAALFRSLSADATAVLNADDARSDELRRLTAASVLTYGSAPSAGVRLLEAVYENSGTRARMATPSGELELHCHLPGPRNMENVMAAAAAALSLGVDLEAIATGVAALQTVPGRWERIDCGQPFEVVVDFAHTDDALRKLLAAVRALQPARIITVFGCGGDRDRGKRPLMGEAAATGSDVVILSSDNPRGEDPQAIADDTQAGIDAAGRDIEMHQIPDRGEAIRFAIGLAQPGDTVVIAGKGHENVQVIGDRSSSFDDREHCRSSLEQRFGGGDRG